MKYFFEIIFLLVLVAAAAFINEIINDDLNSTYNLGGLNG